MNNYMALPLISIIIPAYNAQDHIEECVLSVCNQKVSLKVSACLAHSGSFMEVIIIDDGSSDKTAEICDRLSSEYAYIKVIHVKNGGVSKARNLGLENASGRYIAFVDADDTVSETYISDLLECAIDNDAALVIMDGKIVTDDVITGRRYLEDGLLCEDTHVWGKLFRRMDLIINGDHIRFPEGITIGEDMLFFMEFLIALGDRKCVSCIEGNGYHYNLNDDGAMLKTFTPSYMDQIICWERAGELLVTMTPEVSVETVRRLSVIKIMAALLVVGKFAKILNMSENKDRAMLMAMKEEVVTRASGMIDNAKETSGAYGRLSFGYKIKVFIFSLSPDLYMKLYGQWKSL
ncbi:glycosyltransferase family 2 protein [Butyrivibrio sp. VCD2006]|uniref:glycosyltransferase family 2 protein n=1 Tax=Butyrivibrio sp. VCD2006 TaxID=1280664 RepID=UPI0004250BE2|nr:glycosyltransferase [Butyrivibrio sp. VCD2006]